MVQNSMYLVSRCMVHALYTLEVRKGANQCAKDLNLALKDERMQRRKEAPRCKEFCEPSTDMEKHGSSSRNNKQVGLPRAEVSLN